MALTTTPETLHEIAQLHAKIAQLERMAGIRQPGGDPAAVEPPPPFAAGLHEIVAGFADEMVIVCNIAGDILLANHGTERVLGYRPNELVGTNAWSYVHPEDLKATATARSAPLDDGIPFENRAMAADGSYRWVEFTARRWPQTDPTHVVLRFRRAMHREPPPEADVAFGSSKLHVQLRYAASLARLSQLALGLPLVSDVLDAGATLGASGLALEVGAWLQPDGEELVIQNETGLEPGMRGKRLPLQGSLAGVAWKRGLAVDDSQLDRTARATDPLLALANAACAIAAPVRGTDRIHGVLFLAGRSGRTFEPEDTHFAETVANVLATALDSRAAQETLARRERLTRAVFDHARDGLAIVDDEGRCVDANLAAHLTLEIAPGSLRGARPSEVAATDLDLAPHARAPKATGEATVRTGAGKRSLEYELVGGILPGLSLAIFRDVTERREMQGRLALADRLVAVGTLAAGVAHELNTPLSYVSANLEYLADLVPRLASPDDPRLPHAREALEESSEGVARMRGILDDLRTFVRASAEGDSSADVAAVIRSAISMTWNEIRHRAQLVRHLDPVPPVAGNPARLVQVFVNLLVNAAHAIPPGAATEHRIRVSARTTSDGLVEVEIADTGPGIAPEILGRIFDPFFTTKPDGMGTGLGLPICRSILSAIGGTIEFDSDGGHGTVARVTLQPREASRPSERSTDRQPPVARRGRVLFVDDDQRLGSALRRALGDEHEVTAVGSPWVALRLLERKERFDAVVTDQLMPEMLGIDLQRALVEADPDLRGRIILMSGGAMTEEERRTLEAGQIRFLRKPIDLGELKGLLAELLGGRPAEGGADP